MYNMFIYPASRLRHAQARVAVDCLDLQVGLLVGICAKRKRNSKESGAAAPTSSTTMRRASQPRRHHGWCDAKSKGEHSFYPWDIAYI